MKTYDFKQYKNAKKAINDLQKIDDVLEYTIEELMPYFNFYPVRDILGNIRKQKSTIEAKLTASKKILATKGLINEKKNFTS